MSVRIVVLLAAGVLLTQARAGELTRRFERTLERVMRGGPPAYSESFVLADLIPDSDRRFADFSGDLSGRYLGAMALSGPAALETAEVLAPRVFALQRADGGFGAALSEGGASEDDMARLWGHGRLLVGLVEYYEATGDERSLEAARRLGDFLAGHAERFNAASVRRQFQDGAMAHGYICWTQNVEGLALLARATGEQRYRTAASEIAEAIERRPGQHAHGWLSSLRGLALLAESDAELPPRLEAEWDEYVASGNLLWTGGPPEYFAPGIARDEGCASADWVRLNLALWRLTGRERYLEAAEEGLFNALFANQQPSGDFGHLRITGEGFDYGAVQAWWCCTLHGLRAFPAVREATFRADDGVLYYDLPVDGRGSLGELEIEADAELAREGRVTLRVIQAPSEPVAVKIRKPARTAELRSQSGSTGEDWLVLERVWNAGEELTVEYVFETSVDERGGVRLVRRGPWTLGVSEGTDGALFGEGARGAEIDWEDLTAADRPSRLSTRFQPEAYGGESGAITLRPIAERWESGANALRWRTRFGANARGETKADPLGWFRRNARALAIGLAAGLLLGGAMSWRLRRRTAPR